MLACLLVSCPYLASYLEFAIPAGIFCIFPNRSVFQRLDFASDSAVEEHKALSRKRGKRAGANQRVTRSTSGMHAVEDT